jgi:hypothetical protein
VRGVQQHAHGCHLLARQLWRLETHVIMLSFAAALENHDALDHRKNHQGRMKNNGDVFDMPHVAVPHGARKQLLYAVVGQPRGYCSLIEQLQLAYNVI